MAIMRVEKTANYTVMANYHLRDNRLSLKAKGLLSVMLALPPEWDFTLRGLSSISKEGISAIRAAITELEESGYVIRARVRNKAGQLTDTEYTIYELPQEAAHDHENDTADATSPTCEKPTLEKPTLENPTLDNPTLEKPTLDSPTLENRTQLNTNRKKKEIKNTYTSNPYPSNIHPSISGTDRAGIPAVSESPSEQISFIPSVEPPDESVVIPRKSTTDALTEQQLYLSEPSSLPDMRRRLSFQELVRKIKGQIEYWDLIDGNDKDEIDNILSIMVEVMTTKCEYFTISGKKYPADLVHQRYSQINYHTVLYVLECMHKCGSDIRNIKQYLIATLFNAPATCDSYYSAAVRRDFEYLRG